MPKARNGTVTKKITGRVELTKKLITIEKISISGLLIAVRISIIKANCTLVISVVRRVTSDDELNLSMFEKENFCTFSNISLLKFLAKPADALAQNLPPSIPAINETIAAPTIIKPYKIIPFTSGSPLDGCTHLPKKEISKGISTSIPASTTIHKTVSTVSRLYSRKHLANFFIISISYNH